MSDNWRLIIPHQEEAAAKLPQQNLGPEELGGCVVLVVHGER